MIFADKRFLGFTSALIVLYIVTVAFFYQFPFSKSIYRDMVGSYAAASADYLHDQAIMQGRDEGGFYPKAAMTRAELLNIMLRVEHVDTEKLKDIPAETRFKDVPSNHWAASVVKTADEKGLIFFSDAKGGNLNPDQPITRGELAAAIVDALKLQPGNKPIFISDIKGSPYEKEINTMVSNGFATGYDDKKAYNFKPDQDALREEVAQLWANALKGTHWEKTPGKGDAK